MVETLSNSEIIKATKQRVWGRIAVLNFVLGGSGAGYYILMVIITSLVKPENDHSNDYFKLIAPAVVGTAFLSLAFEMRFPKRILYLANNLKTSWMSRETIFGMSFIFLAVTDYFLPHTISKTVALCMACGYLICQSCVIYSAKAIPIWNTRASMPSIFLSSIYGGNAWLFLTQTYLLKNVYVSIAVVISILANIIFWLVYISTVKRILLVNGMQVFRHRKLIYFSLTAGLLVPVFLLMSAIRIIVPIGIDAWFFVGFSLFTAVWIFGFSAFQKIKVIKDFSQMTPINLSFPDVGSKAI